MGSYPTNRDGVPEDTFEPRGLQSRQAENQPKSRPPRPSGRLKKIPDSSPDFLLELFEALGVYSGIEVRSADLPAFGRC
jgi:hypothetical protein